MRTIAIINRVIKQMLRDKRTLAMMFLAPLLIMSLMYFLFQNNSDAKAKLGVQGVDTTLVKAIDNQHLTISHYSKADSTTKTIRQHDLDGMITQNGDKLKITYTNSNPTNTSLIKQSLQGGLTKLTMKRLATGAKQEKKAIVKLQAGLKQAIKTQQQAALTKAKAGLAQAKASGNQAAVKQAQAAITKIQAGGSVPSQAAKTGKQKAYTTTSHYLFGSSDSSFFQSYLPIFLGFFVFFFVFLISGISLLNERTTGTLSRLLATPVRRGEIIAGYVVGYGIFALVQTFLTVGFAITVFKVQPVGSIGLVFLINFMLALVALAMGIFISTFANSEFEMMQFIPLLVVPQVFFSGLIPVSNMANWLQVVAHIMPLYYGGNALTAVITKGASWSSIGLDLGILLIFIVGFLILNVTGMKRYRKV